jgi:hypothetical protein
VAGGRSALVLPDVLVACEDTAEVNVQNESLVGKVAVDVALVVGDEHRGSSPGGGIGRVRADVLGSCGMGPG